MSKSFGCQLFFSQCRSMAGAALPVSGSCTRTAHVAVIVRALPVSGSVYSCTRTA